MPDDFSISEIDIAECLEDTTEGYRHWMKEQLARVGKLHLLK